MDVNEYLKGLGESSQEVADSLMEDGITGVPKNVVCCAVLEGIKKNFPNTVGDFEAPSVGEIISIDFQCLDPICPPSVKDFMEKFDSRQYPKLEV